MNKWGPISSTQLNSPSVPALKLALIFYHDLSPRARLDTQMLLVFLWLFSCTCGLHPWASAMHATFSGLLVTVIGLQEITVIPQGHYLGCLEDKLSSCHSGLQPSCALMEAPLPWFMWLARLQSRGGVLPCMLAKPLPQTKQRETKSPAKKLLPTGSSETAQSIGP